MSEQSTPGTDGLHELTVEDEFAGDSDAPMLGTGAAVEESDPGEAGSPDASGTSGGIGGPVDSVGGEVGGGPEAGGAGLPDAEVPDPSDLIPPG